MKYGTLEEADGTEMTVESNELLSPVKKRTQSNTGHLQTKFQCFVCDTERQVDRNPYNKGGLGRCSIEATAENPLQERRPIYVIAPVYFIQLQSL